MTLIKFVYRKLVRDNVLASMKSKGEIPTSRSLDEKGYKQELTNKLTEELTELSLELDKPIDSLVDLQEVIDCLLTVSGYSKEDLLKAHQAKKLKYVSFTNRTFIESVEVPVDSKRLYYLEQHPDKYPEIVNKR